mgnify:CR=1 FL=1
MVLAKLNNEAEIFTSLQGEGHSIGKPSIFIRLSNCNLHCHWCDTDYTWNWDNTPWAHINDAKKDYKKFNKKDHQIHLSPEELAEKILKLPTQNIIITGGEPLLQQKEIIAFVSILKKADTNRSFEIETNGTIKPSTELIDCIDQFNVSPKLANSLNPENKRIEPKAIQVFLNSNKAYWKFVMDTEQDLEEINELVAAYKLPKNRVYLMPQATTREALEKKQNQLVKACVNLGYCYSHRLHVMFWGDTRGV